MEITKVKFYDISRDSNSNFLSKCSIVLDDSLILHDIKVLTGKKGRYIIMPPKMYSENRKGVCDDVFHPVSHHYFNYMSEVILRCFRKFEEDGVPSVNLC